MTKFNFDNIEIDCLDLTKIVQDRKLSHVTRDLAQRLIDGCEYITLGSFLKNMNKRDTLILQALCVRAQDDQDPDSIFEIMVLSDMLAQAEGVVIEGAEQSCANCNFFMSLIHALVMQQAGLAEIVWSRLSMDPSMANEVIVKFRSKK